MQLYGMIVWYIYKNQYLAGIRKYLEGAPFKFESFMQVKSREYPFRVKF